MKHKWDDKQSKLSAKCIICDLHRYVEKYNNRPIWVYYKNNSNQSIFKCPKCKPSK